jgi:hypothetical protein
MTEQEWLNGTTRSLIRYLRPPDKHLLRRDVPLPPEYQDYGSERKVRLFSCACCEALLPIFNDHELRMHRMNEAFAEQGASDDEIAEANGCAMRENPRPGGVDIYVENGAPADYAQAAVYGLVYGPEDVAWMAYIATQMMYPGGQPTRFHEDVGQRPLLHCIFGNPFRPVTFDAAWQTTTVTGLAAAIYAEKSFDRMPILADALEESGCTDGDILSHCRGPGPHVRGCWVVDLVLGKQ